MKDKIEKIKKWIYANPKTFYKYSMILLIVSFILSIVQAIYFPAKAPNDVIKPPTFYSNSDKASKKSFQNDEKIKKIIEELNQLKAKRDNSELTKNDSLRIDYLYNQYQNLKNGH